MAFGYEIFDQSGALLVSNLDNTGLILGGVSITSANQSGSVTNADLARGVPFYWFVPPTSVANGTPDITFSGTTMSWTASGTTFVGYIWYGIL